MILNRNCFFLLQIVGRHGKRFGTSVFSSLRSQHNSCSWITNRQVWRIDVFKSKFINIKLRLYPPIQTMFRFHWFYCFTKYGRVWRFVGQNTSKYAIEHQRSGNRVKRLRRKIWCDNPSVFWYPSKVDEFGEKQVRSIACQVSDHCELYFWLFLGWRVHGKTNRHVKSRRQN